MSLVPAKMANSEATIRGGMHDMRVLTDAAANNTRRLRRAGTHFIYTRSTDTLLMRVTIGRRGDRNMYRPERLFPAERRTDCW
jgi:hypothetical protein